MKTEYAKTVTANGPTVILYLHVSNYVHTYRVEVIANDGSELSGVFYHTEQDAVAQFNDIVSRNDGKKVA